MVKNAAIQRLPAITNENVATIMAEQMVATKNISISISTIRYDWIHMKDHMNTSDENYMFGMNGFAIGPWKRKKAAAIKAVTFKKPKKEV